jgi:phosphatidylglycerol:prolipoprotein diacylglycerol transferase
LPSDIAFDLGPIVVRWYGIMLTLGIVGAVMLTWVEAKRRGELADHTWGMALLVVPLGILGARAYHVIHQWDYYAANPGQILGFAGLGIWGAIAGGALGLIIYCLWQKLSIWRWLDCVAPGLVLAQAVGRWGNFFNQELYGYPTDLPWGLYIDPAHRSPEFAAYDRFHPLFLYESLWNLLGFTLLMVLGRKYAARLKDGDLFLAYVIWYAVGRFFLEGLKPDVWTIGGLPTARWICIGGVVIAAALLVYRRRKPGAVPAA